jgi:hypothetical protein
METTGLIYSQALARVVSQLGMFRGKPDNFETMCSLNMTVFERQSTIVNLQSSILCCPRFPYLRQRNTSLVRPGNLIVLKYLCSAGFTGEKSQNRKFFDF